MIKVLCVAGARPNFPKIAPIMRALSGSGAFEAKLVHTGQHYDDKLSKVFFDDLGIPKPDIELEVGSASHAVQTAEIMKRFEEVLQAEQPHAVIVVGDVNSTAACAMVTAKFQLGEPFTCKPHGERARPLMIHVEAGLRSFDDDMPEEVNRKVTDVLSDLLMVSDPAGLDNLAKEGIDESRVRFIGNVMIDTLLRAKEQAMTSTVLDDLGLEAGGYGLLTMHRPSNVDDPDQLRHMIELLDDISREVPLVFPIHPRTKARLEALGIELDASRWTVTGPLGYLDFLRLMADAKVVLSDSGGIQEETTVLGVRCVTLRDNTERPVTIEEGTNVLAGTRRETIMPAYTKSMSEEPAGRVPRFWDGKSAERLRDALLDVFA